MGLLPRKYPGDGLTDGYLNSITDVCNAFTNLTVETPLELVGNHLRLLNQGFWAIIGYPEANPDINSVHTFIYPFQECTLDVQGNIHLESIQDTAYEVNDYELASGLVVWITPTDDGMGWCFEHCCSGGTALSSSSAGSHASQGGGGGGGNPAALTQVVPVQAETLCLSGILNVYMKNLTYINGLMVAVGTPYFSHLAGCCNCATTSSSAAACFSCTDCQNGYPLIWQLIISGIDDSADCTLSELNGTWNLLYRGELDENSYMWTTQQTFNNECTDNQTAPAWNLICTGEHEISWILVPYGPQYEIMQYNWNQIDNGAFECCNVNALSLDETVGDDEADFPFSAIIAPIGECRCWDEEYFGSSLSSTGDSQWFCVGTPEINDIGIQPGCTQLTAEEVNYYTVYGIPFTGPYTSATTCNQNCPQNITKNWYCISLTGCTPSTTGIVTSEANDCATDTVFVTDDELSALLSTGAAQISGPYTSNAIANLNCEYGYYCIYKDGEYFVGWLTAYYVGGPSGGHGQLNLDGYNYISGPYDTYAEASTACITPVSSTGSCISVTDCSSCCIPQTLYLCRGTFHFTSDPTPGICDLPPSQITLTYHDTGWIDANGNPVPSPGWYGSYLFTPIGVCLPNIGTVTVSLTCFTNIGESWGITFECNGAAGGFVDTGSLVCTPTTVYMSFPLVPWSACASGNEDPTIAIDFTLKNTTC